MSYVLRLSTKSVPIQFCALNSFVTVCCRSKILSNRISPEFVFSISIIFWWWKQYIVVYVTLVCVCLLWLSSNFDCQLVWLREDNTAARTWSSSRVGMSNRSKVFFTSMLTSHRLISSITVALAVGSTPVTGLDACLYLLMYYALISKRLCLVNRLHSYWLLPPTSVINWYSCCDAR